MTLKFRVTGMTCAACSARVEKVTRLVPGVEQVQVNLLKGTMNVETEDPNIAEAVMGAVNGSGYRAEPFENTPALSQPQKDVLHEMRTRIISSAIVLAVLMYFTMGHMVGLPVPAWYHGTPNAVTAALLQFLLTLPVLYWNRAYYFNGFRSLWKRSPNMDSLIAVGSGAAMIYGIVALFRMSYSLGSGDLETVGRYRSNLYFESAAMILTLITLGKFLETRAKGKTGEAVRQLMDLKPKTAWVRVDGAEKEVSIEQVGVGDTVVVRSGGQIPVDGTVLSGRAYVDKSALTGESIPVEVEVGDSIPASAINTEGYLEIRAEKVGEDTTLAQVIRLVDEAGGSKAPIARLADKVAGIFVPTVMAIAFLAFVIWLALGQSLEFALTTGISVLVISCPCALGLATPVAIMVGIGRGAKMGVLFKNAEALENLHRIQTVVLDKTGTLTEGKPSVTDILPVEISRDDLLSLAASLEQKSEHPFAKAILAALGPGELKETVAFETLPGRGVSGIIENVRYYGGNRRLMKELGLTVPAYAELEKQGKTPLYFAAEDRYLGVIAAADVLKADSAQAVAQMRKMGLQVIMLTGDNRSTAEAIAEKAGISRVIPDVLPGDKAGVIKELQADGQRVLMVGDGINDAPALVSADVGMAIGAGTDIAMESAQVVLINGALSGVCEAIALSKATIRNIRQNLFWAFFYNSLGIPVAAGVLYPAFGIQLSPMMGAAAMSMSSVFVVTNALRLRFFRTNKREDRQIKDQNKEFVQEDKNMETVIKVNGMMCPHCKARVESVCKEVAGTVNAVVDLEKKQVTVTGDASVEELKKVIAAAGYEVVE